MMKRTKFFACALLIFLIAPLKFSYSTENRSIAFHATLGEVINDRENSDYNIFGEIPGFASARIYKQDENNFKLHVLRNVDTTAQIIILKLSFEDFNNFGHNLAVRMHSVAKNESQTSLALYPIDSTKWNIEAETSKLILNDGSQLLVKMERAQNDTLFVRMLNGLPLTVPDVNIFDVEDVSAHIQEGKYYRKDPNISRMLFAPTAHKLEAGTGYFADYFIFFPTLAFGITDYLSLSGGISILPGADSQVIYFAPKLTFTVAPDFGLATGFLYMTIPGETDDLSLGYAVATKGNHRRSFTVGSGVSLSSDIDSGIILLFGGETQISNSAKLISENWLFTGNETTLLFSGGVRFFGEKLAVDLALISSEEFFNGNGFPFAPWVDFSYFFKK